MIEAMAASGIVGNYKGSLPRPVAEIAAPQAPVAQAETVALIADRLRPGGVLHAATDHAGYAEQIAEVGDAEARCGGPSRREMLPISVQRPITKYEGKARHAGSAVTELIWVRRP